MLDKLDTVNAAIAIFAPGTSVRKGPNGWVVEWLNHNGKVYSRRWSVMGGGSLYPVWHHKWAHGGTCCNALSQLIRWLQDRPVFGISTWQYWASPSVRLGDNNGQQLLEVLEAGGYPTDHVCVLCNTVISPRTTGLDWWDLGGVSGPCCRDRSKCPNNTKT
jgi:hypothetical protein